MKDVVSSVIEAYNCNSHGAVGNRTPDEVLTKNDAQIVRHLTDSAHNQRIYQSVPFAEGQKVRVIEQKEGLMRKTKIQ